MASRRTRGERRGWSTTTVFTSLQLNGAARATRRHRRQGSGRRERLRQVLGLRASVVGIDQPSGSCDRPGGARRARTRAHGLVVHGDVVVEEQHQRRGPSVGAAVMPLRDRAPARAPPARPQDSRTRQPRLFRQRKRCRRGSPVPPERLRDAPGCGRGHARVPGHDHGVHGKPRGCPAQGVELVEMLAPARRFAEAHQSAPLKLGVPALVGGVDLSQQVLGVVVAEAVPPGSRP